jgi:hypothetical protein
VDHQRARRRQLGGHVGQHVLDGLELADGAAELAAREGVVARVAQRHLCQAHHGRAVQQAVDGDAPQRQRQAAAALADQVGGGHARTLQDDVAGGRLAGHGLVAELARTPGAFRSTKKAEISRDPGSAVGCSAVEAISTAQSAKGEPEMKRLRPVSTQSSPSCTARVSSAPASEPAPASVSAKQIAWSARATGRMKCSI